MNDVMEQIKTLSATLDEETTRFHPTGKLLLLGSYESIFLKAVNNWDGVERVVTEALAHGNKVVINADW